MPARPAPLHRHRFFIIAVIAGIAAFIAASLRAPLLALPVAGDVFFGSYTLAMLILAARATPAHLKKQAAAEDFSTLIIVALTLGAIAFSLIEIFTLLNRDVAGNAVRLALSIISAPLGWLMLHTLAAFHYAHLYYGAGKHRAGLNFADCDEPGPWDFLYHSFVVGMTAQVSDVQVTSTSMRRVVLAHSIASFFFNTVLLALAVNVAVVLAQAG